MYIAYSNDNEIRANGEYGGVVTTIMKHLLEEKIVDAVLCVKEGHDIYDAVPFLVTRPSDISLTSGSMHCGTLNMAKFIYKYLNGCRDMKIAVSCKPCDAMTINELIKKGKIIKDNIILIGVNCGGTLPPVKTMKMIEEIYELNPKDVVKEEISKGKLIIKTKDGEKAIAIDELEEKGWGRRENCRRCSLKIPYNADLGLGNWGVTGELAGKATFVEVFTDKGQKILDEVNDLIEIRKAESEEIKIRQKINEIMLSNSTEKKEKDYEGSTGDIIDVFHKYEDEFSKCMKCYGCREACPICFCEECCLESEGPEWIPGGYTPAPPLFHLTRMVHMVDSCTNCGQCSEVCPCEIPLSKIWSTVNNKIRKTYGYVPGFAGENRIPLTQYDTKTKKL